MLLSCIGQRSLSNSGVLEGLLNLLDNLLSPLQQPLAAAQRRTEGRAGLERGGARMGEGCHSQTLVVCSLCFTGTAVRLY